ncbi:thioredoxin family protein [Sulfurovum sp. XTW-4]|uniref:Thioredoxin family protein n=1 Tax=Sulfurovum xiamenensis TaxID=3019066 RepID=A0ABT7QSV0_9BACT|nr:thioredoxin family protein [Sulfurovum xiamenensis]MDM5264160.1 thioredoxin family protein [Sulfurovum xiamenensis]
MNKIVLGVLLFSSLLFSVEWSKDLETAFATAKKEHKNIMVLVEGENCRWCKKLKHRTLADEAVEKRLEKFVTVKVMREDAFAMSELPEVKGVPTIFFMNEDKVISDEILGYVDVEDMIYYINDIEKK